MAQQAARISARPQTGRSRAMLSELIAAGPSFTAAGRMVSELRGADKRLSSLLVFLPFVGPWRFQRSKWHSRAEKFWLTWLSIGLTALGVWAIVDRLPTPGNELEVLRARIAREQKSLVEFADRYRAQHGTYPDQMAWQHYADRADPMFFDPWGRRYRYDSASGEVTITTLGRDGVVGGIGDDADVSFPTLPHS